MVADALLGAVIAFALATMTTPVGVSGAVFLVPVQVSVLEVPSPALTPTNLLYNLIAIPGRSSGTIGGSTASAAARSSPRSWSAWASGLPRWRRRRSPRRS